MLKKATTIVCLVMLVFSISSVALVSTGYASSTPWTEATFKCDFTYCGTQNCVVMMLLSCVQGWFVYGA